MTKNCMFRVLNQSSKYHKTESGWLTVITKLTSFNSKFPTNYQTEAVLNVLKLVKMIAVYPCSLSWAIAYQIFPPFHISVLYISMLFYDLYFRTCQIHVNLNKLFKFVISCVFRDQNWNPTIKLSTQKQCLSAEDNKNRQYNIRDSIFSEGHIYI